MSKKILVSLIATLILILCVSMVWAGMPESRNANDFSSPSYNYNNYSKGGGIYIATTGAFKRFQMYGGHNMARLDDGLVYVVYAGDEPTRGVYFVSSEDTLGNNWGTPLVIADVNTYYQTSYAHLAVNPNNHDNIFIAFRAQLVAGNYHTYIVESNDRGVNWSEARGIREDVATNIGDVSWATIQVDNAGWLHLTFAWPGNSELHYTKSNDGGLTWVRADGTADGVNTSEGISYVPSGVVFQGPVEMDRDGNPHVIFSGDGGADTFGDKTPYHIWHDGSNWRPIPPTKLQAELESTWGIPEMIFDANNRGYYFFSQNSPNNAVVIGTWEPPSLSGNDDGTVNGGLGADGAVSFVEDNYPGVGITTDNDLWLPQPYIIDAGDDAGVYFGAATGSWSGDEDIVVFKTPILAETSTLGPADLSWSLVRWLTNDGAGGPDNCLDLPEIGSDKHVDVIWASSGAAGWEIQYLDALADVPAKDATPIAIDYGIDYSTDETCIIRKDASIQVIATIKNGGTGANAPHNVYLRITRVDDGKTIVNEQTKSTTPMGAAATADITFDAYVIDAAWVTYQIEVETDLAGDEAEYNDIISLGFQSWPSNADTKGQFCLQDTLADGNLDLTGWAMFDSVAPNPDTLATWFLAAEFGDYDYCWKVRYNVGSEQSMNELLYTPSVYIGNLTKADSLFLLLRHDLTLSPDANVPVWAYLDVQVGNTYDDANWETVEHWERQDAADPGINTGDTYAKYSLDNIVDYSTSDSLWVRFWFGYPNNDGRYSEWAIDNITIMYGTLVGVDTEILLGNLPKDYTLEQNYPNPFNPNTAIRFATPENGNVALNIYNIKGQLVRTLVDEKISAGTHTANWDGKDNSGNSVSSGVYFYTLETKDIKINKKMLLLK